MNRAFNPFSIQPKSSHKVQPTLRAHLKTKFHHGPAILTKLLAHKMHFLCALPKLRHKHHYPPLFWPQSLKQANRPTHAIVSKICRHPKTCWIPRHQKAKIPSPRSLRAYRPFCRIASPLWAGFCLRHFKLQHKKCTRWVKASSPL